MTIQSGGEGKRVRYIVILLQELCNPTDVYFRSQGSVARRLHRAFCGGVKLGNRKASGGRLPIKYFKWGIFMWDSQLLRETLNILGILD